MEKENKALSILEKLKQKTQAQTPYGGEAKAMDAKMDATVCPNCGAGRAKTDGLTKCGYCGFVFIEKELTDGINIKKEDNSL
jgi:uncharacterized Zn finger protein (UPF0148 family)